MFQGHLFVCSIRSFVRSFVSSSSLANFRIGLAEESENKCPAILPIFEVGDPGPKYLCPGHYFPIAD